MSWAEFNTSSMNSKSMKRINALRYVLLIAVSLLIGCTTTKEDANNDGIPDQDLRFLRSIAPNIQVPPDVPPDLETPTATTKHREALAKLRGDVPPERRDAFLAFGVDAFIKHCLTPAPSFEAIQSSISKASALSLPEDVATWATDFLSPGFAKLPKMEGAKFQSDLLVAEETGAGTDLVLAVEIFYGTLKVQNFDPRVDEYLGWQAVDAVTCSVGVPGASQEELVDALAQHLGPGHGRGGWFVRPSGLKSTRIGWDYEAPNPQGILTIDVSSPLDPTTDAAPIPRMGLLISPVFVEPAASGEQS